MKPNKAAMDLTTEAEATKAKATKANVQQLVALNIFNKTYKTGSQGFFGQMVDPATGDKYQIIGAVKIAKK